MLKPFLARRRRPDGPIDRTSSHGTIARHKCTFSKAPSQCTFDALTSLTHGKRPVGISSCCHGFGYVKGFVEVDCVGLFPGVLLKSSLSNLAPCVQLSLRRMDALAFISLSGVRWSGSMFAAEVLAIVARVQFPRGCWRSRTAALLASCVGERSRHCGLNEQQCDARTPRSMDMLAGF